MKILMISDIHLRDTPTRFRMPNYYEEQFKKLDWIFSLAKTKKCDFILQAGDWFDNVRSSYHLISDTISLLQKYNIPVYAITGQHDQRYHSNDLTNTPIKILESTGVLNLLFDVPTNIGDINIYGCHYGSKIPETQNESAFNILVIHKMVIKADDEKLWHGQTNYSTSRMLLAKNKFNVILSGDNHHHLVDSYQGRDLLNLGSMMRSTTAQLGHKPTVAIYDTNTKTYELFEIPILPSSEVFNLEEVKKIKDHKEIDTSIKEYVDILNGNDSETKELNFVSNLDRFVTKNNVRESVASIIKSTLEC